MNRVAKAYEDITFSCIEGSWIHGYYREFQKELRWLGYHSIAAMQDTDHPHKDLDQHAQDLTDEEECAGLENIVRFAHSSGFNIAVRNADHVMGIEAVASGADPSTYRPSPEQYDLFSSRYSDDFDNGTVWPGPNARRSAKFLTMFRKTMAEAVFLDHSDGTRIDIDEDERRLLVQRLRPKRRHPEEPRLEGGLPDKLYAYFAMKYDSALNFNFEVNFAREVLGVEPVVMECGHTPMVESPKLMAELAVREALKFQARPTEVAAAYGNPG
ncbi:MAG: hypothetical protein JWO96_752 [Candidatus Saccharibacteria bacterium]|nr:hypothetical protein [Candidatus Saccharibacteria bacterium]